MSSYTGVLVHNLMTLTIFVVCLKRKRNWYSSAQAAEKRWGIPIAVNMAVIYQESSFKARARPNRSKILWVLPGRRPSSAYGYAQALDSTWNDYKKFSGKQECVKKQF